LNEMVLDKYSFVRDAYLQKRRAQVRRGPPTDSEDEQENFDRPDKK